MSEKVEIIPGNIYEGKVVRLKPFGAIVILPDNSQGLVHISHLAEERVNKVEDVVNIGDIINVKVTEIDRQGRINLSRREIRFIGNVRLLQVFFPD